MQLTALACHPALAYGGLRHYSGGPRRSYSHFMRVRTSPTKGYYRLRSRSGSFLTLLCVLYMHDVMNSTFVYSKPKALTLYQQRKTLNQYIAHRQNGYPVCLNGGQQEKLTEISKEQVKHKHYGA